MRALSPFPFDWRILVLFLATALAVFLGAVATGRADTIGWRIEAKACRGAVCRALPTTGRVEIKYVCTGRASRLADAAALGGVKLPGLPAGAWQVRVSCVPIEGMPRA